MRQICFIAVSSLCTLPMMAQTAVRNEPRHHNVFENDYIRILDLFLPPHDTTQFHVHNTPSVFTTFTKTLTGSQLLNDVPARSESTPGSSRYDSLITPRIHRVWNEDTSWFHVMDIELTAQQPHSAPPALQYSSLTLLFHEPLVNGYHLQLEPGRTLDLPASGAGYLLLSMGEGTVEYRNKDMIHHRLMRAGHYIWIDPGNSFSFTNRGMELSSFLLMQLK